MLHVHAVIFFLRRKAVEAALRHRGGQWVPGAADVVCWPAERRLASAEREQCVAQGEGDPPRPVRGGQIPSALLIDGCQPSDFFACDFELLAVC